MTVIVRLPLSFPARDQEALQWKYRPFENELVGIQGHETVDERSDQGEFRDGFGLANN